MKIQLKKAKNNELKELHRLQVASFKPLLQMYGDYDTNPGADGLDRIEKRFAQPFTTYFFIVMDEQKVGAIRIIYHEEKSSIRISPMFVHPDFQGLKIGQQAMLLLEGLYDSVQNWSLETILQEPKLCHFYEKLGYVKTGEHENIQKDMDIVFYEKHKDKL